MNAPASVYVSCNPKEGPVARYSARGAIIGAIRDARKPKEIAYNPEEVVEIPGAEFAEFQQEYGEALRSGALIRRTKADFDKWVAGEDARSQKAYDERKAAEKEAKTKRLAAEAEERKKLGLAEPAPTPAAPAPATEQSTDSSESESTESES